MSRRFYCNFPLTCKTVLSYASSTKKQCPMKPHEKLDRWGVEVIQTISHRIVRHAPGGRGSLLEVPVCGDQRRNPVAPHQPVWILDLNTLYDEQPHAMTALGAPGTRGHRRNCSRTRPRVWVTVLIQVTRRWTSTTCSIYEVFIVFRWISKISTKGKVQGKSIPTLSISALSSYEDYNHHAIEHQDTSLASWLFEKSIIPNTCTEFTFNGYCYVCRTSVDFLVDFQYSYQLDGVLMPNWRERLVCPGCHLNNRMRAAVHIFDRECKPERRSAIYITEQTTALYTWLRKSFLHVCGSEYLGDSVDYGSCNNNGIRNEDLTQLSFDNDEFDYILSFDVFEHIPDYKKALSECCRCLKPGGILYFSVPFVKTAANNIVRACLSDVGEAIHLLPPEYHADPLSSDGCLSFYQFGWEILDDLRTLGFRDAKALLYWSREFGYLGGEQIIFMATKIPRNEKA